MIADPRLKHFRCPLCGSNNCMFVGVRSKTGEYHVVKDFYQCAGCTVMFTNPQAFMQLTRDTFTGTWRERKPTREYPPDSET